MTWRGTVTVKDRIFAALPYLLPLISGLMFGRFLFTQFPALQVIFVPLMPVLLVYTTIPFASLIIFFALFLLVVRNERIPHFIRFNTLQAILIDIVLAVCSYILPLLGRGFVAETLSNVIFLATLAACGYSVVQSLLGRYAEIPPISEAVYMQVR